MDEYFTEILKCQQVIVLFAALHASQSRRIFAYLGCANTRYQCLWVLFTLQILELIHKINNYIIVLFIGTHMYLYNTWILHIN